MNLTRNLVVAVLMTVVTTLLLGVVYPLAVTGLAQLLFPDKANGQLIERGGALIGSRIIGQPFSSPGYFRGRPSAAGTGYDAANSGGTNLGPTNKTLIDAVAAAVDGARKENPEGCGARGALTTFSIANDVAKYFAIIPAMFVVAFPALTSLNVMALKTPQSAILSAVIFNALIIVALVPLALRGIQYRAMSAEALLRRNLLIYGAGGIVVPFIGIKIIDVVITALRLA